MTSAHACAFPSMTTNYDGLGTKPLGLRLQKIVPAWSDRLSMVEVRDFVHNYSRERAPGRPIDVVATELGFDCSDKEKKVCTYEGMYTYDLTVPGSPDQRAAIQISLLLDYGAEPWEMHGSRKFLK